MKRITTSFSTILLCLLMTSSFTVMGQNSSTIPTKKSCEKSCSKALLAEFQSIKSDKVDMHISKEDGNVRFTSAEENEEGEMIMYMRKAKSRATNAAKEQIRVFLADKNEGFKVFQHNHEDEESRVKRKKLLLGIYVDHDNGAEGLKIGKVISGKGAEKAGLQTGDIITKINTAYINNLPDLQIELNKYKTGDEVKVQYTRNGESRQTSIILSESEHWSYERNPCKVFIGIKSGYNPEDGGGLKVISVIEGWPAKKAGIKTGDIILALDEVKVNAHHELVAERNKHAAGDYFTLNILREGIELNVEAQFRYCEEKEVIEEVKKAPAASMPNIEPDNDLSLDAYNAFPNPTYGKVTIEFRALDVPTTIQIVDVTGKVVYKEDLMHFSGYYKKELTLDNANPGTIIINIIQDEKVVSKKVVLLSKA